VSEKKKERKEVASVRRTTISIRLNNNQHHAMEHAD
jgi:hypothetical protein